MENEQTTPASPPSAPTIDVDAIKQAITAEISTALSKQYEEKLSKAVGDIQAKQERAAAVLRGEDPSDKPKPSAFAQALATDPDRAMLSLLSNFEQEFEKKIQTRQAEIKNNADAVNEVIQEVESEYDLPKAAWKYFPSLLQSHFVDGKKPIKEATRAALNELIADYKIEKRPAKPASTVPGGNGLFVKQGEKQSVADYIKMQNEKLRKSRKF